MGIKSKRVAYTFDEKSIAASVRRMEDMTPLELWSMKNGTMHVHSALRGSWYECTRCGGRVEPFKRCGCRS